MANPQIRIISLPAATTASGAGATYPDYLPIENASTGGHCIKVSDFFNNVGSLYYYSSAAVIANWIGNTGDIATFTAGGSGLQDNPGTNITNGVITAGGYQSSSSERYKTNINPLIGATALVEQLQGVRFDWKDKPEKPKQDIGLIAEQVNQIVPEVVAKNANGECESIDYSKLVPVLINALKELTLRVKELEAKN